MRRLESVVNGIPVSVQCKNAARRDRWKETVREAARESIQEEDKIYGECRGAIVFFYFESTDLDVDNIVKPISDALCGIAYSDDKQVTEWIARKSNLDVTALVDPPPLLIGHLQDQIDRREPFVYICVMDQAPNHAELPR